MHNSLFSQEIFSEQLERLIELNKAAKHVAILWDVENVNTGSDSLFVENLINYSTQYGRITILRAFADWSREHVINIGETLSDFYFELIHVPYARKNSADITLITHGVEIAISNPNISTFVLITGDVDFRPLILSFRRCGKSVHIICNVKTAAEDLLVLADSFKDYRELRAGGDIDLDSSMVIDESITQTIAESEIELENEIKEPSKLPLELKDEVYTAHGLLLEAIKVMKENEVDAEFGLVKVRMKMLNPTFDEKLIGFSNWSNFVNNAVLSGIIQTKIVGDKVILKTATRKKPKKFLELYNAFDSLNKVLMNLDKDENPKFHRFALVAEELYKVMNYSILEKMGFKRFRDFVQAAEVRKLVETEIDGLEARVKRLIS